MILVRVEAGDAKMRIWRCIRHRAAKGFVTLTEKNSARRLPPPGPYRNKLFASPRIPPATADPPGRRTNSRTRIRHLQREVARGRDDVPCRAHHHDEHHAHIDEEMPASATTLGINREMAVEAGSSARRPGRRWSCELVAGEEGLAAEVTGGLPR